MGSSRAGYLQQVKRSGGIAAEESWMAQLLSDKSRKAFPEGGTDSEVDVQCVV